MVGVAGWCWAVAGQEAQGAGVSARGLGSRGEEVGGGFGGLPRGKRESAQEECSRHGVVVRDAGCRGQCEQSTRRVRRRGV